ncbi:MAG: cytochrome c-type biogenesis protein CcmH [Actinomycetota bacterium]
MTTASRRMSLTPAARRIAWAVVLVATLVLLVFGAGRNTGPLTQQERIDVITKRIACPTCDGESVFVSRASAAQAIRAEVARQVGDGVKTDDEIVAYVADRFGGQVLLVPRGSGIEALVWVLPVVLAVVLVGVLIVLFRRGNRGNRGIDGEGGGPTSASTGTTDGAPANRRPLVITLAIALVVGIGVGVLVARQSGQRLPLQTATGGIEDSTASLLAQARLAGPTDVKSAIDLYGRVLETDPDNVEALTYRAWLIMLSARQFDESLRTQAYASTITALGRAIELDPAYPDAMCFLGIVVFRDGGDAGSASEFLDKCIARQPPAEVRGLVESLRTEVDAALGK